MWVVIEKILISVISGLAASVVGYYIAKVRKLARKETAIENGVKALLRDRITQMYLYCDAKRFITIHERECLEGYVGGVQKSRRQRNDRGTGETSHGIAYIGRYRQ